MRAFVFVLAGLCCLVARADGRSAVGVRAQHLVRVDCDRGEPRYIVVNSTQPLSAPAWTIAGRDRSRVLRSFLYPPDGATDWAQQ